MPQEHAPTTTKENEEHAEITDEEISKAKAKSTGEVVTKAAFEDDEDDFKRMLDEIDDVLEANAEKMAEEYIQIGGQ